MGILDIEGYASVSGILDDNHRIFAPGWTDGFLAANPGLEVPLLWYHKDGEAIPIGKAYDFAEDDIGLSFRAEILDTAEGRDAAEVMKSFGSLGMSFHFFNGDGYHTDDYDTVVTEAEFD